MTIAWRKKSDRFQARSGGFRQLDACCARDPPAVRSFHQLALASGRGKQVGNARYGSPTNLVRYRSSDTPRFSPPLGPRALRRRATARNRHGNSNAGLSRRRLAREEVRLESLIYRLTLHSSTPEDFATNDPRRDEGIPRLLAGKPSLRLSKVAEGKMAKRRAIFRWHLTRFFSGSRLDGGVSKANRDGVIASAFRPPNGGAVRGPPGGANPSPVSQFRTQRGSRIMIFRLCRMRRRTTKGWAAGPNKHAIEPRDSVGPAARGAGLRSVSSNTD